MPHPDPRAELLARASEIHTWRRGEERAPHKPFLLLLALGRIQRGDERLVPFGEIEDTLVDLLKSYGPPRVSHHPEQPFWYLRTDGLWEIPDADSLPARKGSTNPTAKTLRDAGARGGLPADYDTALRGDPDLVRDVAEIVLGEHFATSLHMDIAARVGLSLEATTIAKHSRPRDPQFRTEVLRAYECRCAVCGYDAQLDGRTIGLEAAHVHWHSHGGPDEVGNGLALCPTHHKLLDLGAFGLSTSRQVIVSKRLASSGALGAILLAHHGKPLRGPQAGEPPVADVRIRWHRKQVFKEPERPLGEAA